MNMRAVIVTLVGLGITMGSMWFAQRVLAPQAAVASVEAKQETINELNVIVARSDIAFAQQITITDLAVVKMPADEIPKGSFKSANGLVAPEGTAPRRARRPIKAGDIISAGALSRFGEKVTMMDLQDPKNRAMSIRVSDSESVGGVVKAGDYVDIVLTQGSNASLRTGTILQNILILGEQEKKKGNSRILMVEVSPKNSQVLSLAQSAGSLSLILRGHDSVAMDELERITMDDVWGLAKDVEVQELAPEPIPTVKTVRIRRGVSEEDKVVD